ncbi:unnamed protein product [Polarella glacialis]|uniref:Stc1 domain-containing protein n=1 Tax=Polarella glacialis TaxID=89957 RepID=A0A813FQQ4_POLGL|nr:unnamed protein product [Polarella glacialis]
MTSQTLLLDQLLKCLPIWVHLYRPGCPRIIWCVDLQCSIGLKELYSGEGWNFECEHGGTDLWSVSHTSSHTRAFWSDDSRFVHQLSCRVATSCPDALVLRILRANGNEARKDSIREIVRATTPLNCLTLWIREDVLFYQARFRPRRAGDHLEQMLCDTTPFDMRKVVKTAVKERERTTGRRAANNGNTDHDATWQEVARAQGRQSGSLAEEAPVEPASGHVGTGVWRCSSCLKEKRSSDFSKKQRQKRKDQAKCLECVDQQGTGAQDA